MSNSNNTVPRRVRGEMQEGKAVQHRTCPACGVRKTLEHFLYLPYPRCNECTPEEERELRQIKAVKEAGDQLARLMDLTGETRRDVPSLDQCLGSILHQYGGFEVFARDAVYHIKYAMETSPGSTRVLNLIQGLLKLIDKRDTNQMHMDVSAMNLEQVEQRRKAVALELLMEVAHDKNKAALLERVLRSASVEPTPDVIDAIKAVN